MKLYLAHPLEKRHTIRAIELYIESHTNVQLINPFYDTNRNDIRVIDQGNIDRTNVKHFNALNHQAIVRGDLDLINACDGTLAIIDKRYHSIGTICEIWHTYRTQKPVYIITDNCSHHPWLKYVIEETKGKFFSDCDEFYNWCKDV